MKTITSTLIILMLMGGCFFFKTNMTNMDNKTDKINNNLNIQEYFLKQPDHSKHKIKINNKQLEVEVVNTSQSTMKGLSSRDQIGADGMLFVFPENKLRTFWMKDMKFDLDIVWIKNGKIVDITQNVPRPLPNTDINSLERYYPNTAVNMVLELESGEAQTLSLEIGQKINLFK